MLRELFQLHLHFCVWVCLYVWRVEKKKMKEYREEACETVVLKQVFVWLLDQSKISSVICYTDTTLFYS